MGSGGGERRSRGFMAGEELPSIERLAVLYVDDGEGL